MRISKSGAVCSYCFSTELKLGITELKLHQLCTTGALINKAGSEILGVFLNYIF